MGLDNKVTALRYQTIKNYCDEQGCYAQDDRTVGKIFGVGVTVVRTIRNTRDYDEYLAKSKRWHSKQAKRRKAGCKVVMPTSGLPLEETPVVECHLCKNIGAEFSSFEKYVITMIIIIAIAVLWLAIKGA